MKLYLPVCLDGAAPWRERIDFIGRVRALELRIASAGFTLLPHGTEPPAEHCRRNGVGIDECVQEADYLIGLGHYPSCGLGANVLEIMRQSRRQAIVFVPFDFRGTEIEDPESLITYVLEDDLEQIPAAIAFTLKNFLNARAQLSMFEFL